MTGVDNIPYGPGPLNGMRVLLVEDNAATAYLLETILMENGARVVATCANSRDALAHLSHSPLDFALIDLHLADQFADELIAETIRRNLRFAILTGMLAFPSNVHEHAVAVLRKPVGRQSLVDLLASYA
ncbi:MAG: response regulator [Hyphomicrobiaceae bacterium]|nr:response regulator [Hyphomicrobiaceae bacterium]